MPANRAANMETGPNQWIRPFLAMTVRVSSSGGGYDQKQMKERLLQTHNVSRRWWALHAVTFAMTGSPLFNLAADAPIEKSRRDMLKNRKSGSKARMYVWCATIGPGCRVSSASASLPADRR
jgi:hypothetical protein